MLAAYSVSEITKYVKALVESDDFLAGVWVRGEISNFTLHSSGHMYFSLKDEASRLRCVMFRSHNSRLGFMPSDGMSVFAYGAIGMYERSGDLQLYVEDMMPQGTGSLYLAFLKLKEKLEKEGLFSSSRKRPIPRFPKVVAVVTSPTGAAVRDVITVIKRRAPGVTVLVVPALVQGDGAPESIVRGLELANRTGFVDVVIVGRGGGSFEELNAFNDESVARAIAASEVPVISAVGHETDFTIADFVADVRAPTPSAAAELAVPDRYELEQTVFQLSMRLNGSIRKVLSDNKAMLESQVRSHVLRFPMEITRDHRTRLSLAGGRLYTLVQSSLSEKRESFRVLAGQLDGLSPYGVLNRGYGFIRKLPEKSVVRSVEQVQPEDEIEVVLSDGSFAAAVKRVLEEGSNGGQGKG
ncbi:MAG: exodeoxyribonuclease VII large subunit [Bacillota bacterium]|jgi:exodeoxyribonuclease VII large subunit